MLQLNYKNRLWVAVVLITILCWVEISYLTEGNVGSPVPERMRHIFHLVLLLAVTGIGYWGWYLHPKKWLKNIWLIAYTSFIVIMLLTSLAYIVTGNFSHYIIGTVRSARLFFSSPMPFLLCYVLSRVEV